MNLPWDQLKSLGSTFLAQSAQTLFACDGASQTLAPSNHADAPWLSRAHVGVGCALGASPYSDRPTTVNRLSALMPPLFPFFPPRLQAGGALVQLQLAGAELKQEARRQQR